MDRWLVLHTHYSAWCFQLLVYALFFSFLFFSEMRENTTFLLIWIHIQLVAGNMNVIKLCNNEMNLKIKNKWKAKWDFLVSDTKNRHSFCIFYSYWWWNLFGKLYEVFSLSLIRSIPAPHLYSLPFSDRFQLLTFLAKINDFRLDLISDAMAWQFATVIFITFFIKIDPHLSTRIIYMFCVATILYDKWNMVLQVAFEHHVASRSIASYFDFVLSLLFYILYFNMNLCKSFSTN